VFLALLVVVLLGVVIYLLTTRQATADCASKGDVNALQKDVSALKETVSKLPETMGKNADTAHNETSELRNAVNENAKRTDKALEHLSDRIDAFIKR